MPTGDYQWVQTTTGTTTGFAVISWNTTSTTVDTSWDVSNGWAASHGKIEYLSLEMKQLELFPDFNS